jgi:hypothetical protein
MRTVLPWSRCSTRQGRAVTLDHICDCCHLAGDPEAAVIAGKLD